MFSAIIRQWLGINDIEARVDTLEKKRVVKSRRATDPIPLGIKDYPGPDGKTIPPIVRQPKPETRSQRNISLVTDSGEL